MLLKKTWTDIKQFYKNKVFENLDNLKLWLHQFIKNQLNRSVIKGITHNNFFNNTFNQCFEI